MNNFKIIDKRGKNDQRVHGDYGFGDGGVQYDYPQHMSNQAGFSISDSFYRKNILSRLRYINKTNPLFRAVINSALINIVGSDDFFNIQIRSEDKQWADEMEKQFHEWLEDEPETRGIYSGIDVFHKIIEEILVAGESFVIMTDRGQLQLIEPELCEGMENDFIDGIEFSDDHPTKYRFGKYNKSGFVSFESPNIVDSDFVIHKFLNSRISSIRGESPLSSSIDLLFRLNKVMRSEIRSWEIISKIALLTLRKDGAERAAFENSDNGMTDDGIYLENWSDEALIFHGSPDEDLKTLERNVPNKNFPETITTFLRIISAPLGIAPELILSDFTKANYSQSRATAILTHRNLKKYQRIVRRIINDIVEWKIDEFNEEISIPEYKIDIFLPKAFMLSTLEEVETLSKKVSTSMASYSEVVGEFGWDSEELLNERKKEIINQIEISKEIKKQTGVDVPWQVLSGISKLAESPKSISEVDQEENNNDK
jgi:capsid protein